MGYGEAPSGGADQTVIEAAVTWLEEGYRLFLLTVLQTWGSSPRPCGSLLAVRADGRMAGSVSGGCVEEDLRERVLTGRIPDGPAGRLRYGEEGERFGLPCGGVLELLVEPLEPGRDHGLAEIRGSLIEGRPIRRTVKLRSGESWVHPDRGEAPDLSVTRETITKRFGPNWRLMIIGGTQLGAYLAEMAGALDYGVTVCEPRREYAREWGGKAPDSRMPDDAVASWRPDSRSAVVTTSHDPKLDDLGLLEALASPAFYVGALGSERTNRRRRGRLSELGLDQAAVDRLRGPMGLPIGSRTPPEIAISVLAEMTAVRNRRSPRLISGPSAQEAEAGIVGQ